MKVCSGPALLLILVLGVPARAEVAFVEVVADPPAVQLTGPQQTHSILVTGRTVDGTLVDLTPQAEFRSQRPKVAQVSTGGVVRPTGDGTTTITVAVAQRQLNVAVTVRDQAAPRRYHFENDVIPLLSRFGCNSSGCHGKAEGQNGFKLSVFGFDPPADHAALTREGRGRRVLTTAPEQSLLLTKISGRVAHGGGTRIPVTSPDYETLRGWIAAGAPVGDPAAPHVVSVKVEPGERQLAMGGQQQLRVLATYSDGRTLDVTQHARFQSNNDGLATVSPTGRVTAGQAPGDVAVMASFMNCVDVFRALVPRAERILDYPTLPEANFIDGHVLRKLRKLQILPSGTADDAEYLRRVYLDVIGTLPTAAEVRRFLADQRPDRRARLVDELLQRPEFADYWALKWADLLRVERQALGHKRAYQYYKWVRDSLAANKPYDQFVREIVTAEGPLAESGPASFYKVVAKPGERASTLSQVFLGVRIACAECHHHPFDRWSQTDYYGMQAFFTPVNVQATPGGEVLLSAGDPVTRHPRTNEVILPHALGAAPSEKTAGDRRAVLAAWMTGKDNPWLARQLVNRTWAHFLGRGLIEPVDDVRDTNPPTNPELLDALARHFVESGYDFRALIRTITASNTYQRSSRPNATNERDEQNYSRALFRRLDAEVLLDMVSQTTGVAEKFPGSAPGARAIQLWDSKVAHYFLKLFGRPERVSACECERNTEPGVSQVLHLLNAPEVHHKLTHEGGSVARLVRELADDGKLVEELYLTCLSRPPAEKERAAAVEFFRKAGAQGRRQAAEDLTWALLNTLEFVFNH